MDTITLGGRARRWPDAWDFEGSYKIGSVRYRVRSNVEKIGTVMGRLLAHLEAERSNGGTTYSLVRTGRSERPFSLFEDEICINQADDPAGLISFILSATAQEAVERVDDALAIHAAAASLEGRGIILPAPADHGKTTTVAGLVRHGFDYLSDEAALLEPGTGLVRPFPRPLAMHASSIEAVSHLREDLPEDHPAFNEERNHVSPEFIRRGAIGRPCPVRYVVAPKYGLGEPTVLDQISRAEAIRVLVENAFNFDRFGAQGLQILRKVVEGADCYRLRIGDLAAAVRLIVDLFERDGREE